MLMLPEDVKCLVCNRIFCCKSCCQKHELQTHSIEEVAHERNQRKCDLCNGRPSLDFVLQNDFQFIMHLCECHLPLHCLKCLTQFHAISDFTTNPKCSHVNGVCKLQSPNQTKMEKYTHGNDSDVYTTAMGNQLNADSNRNDLVSSTHDIKAKNILRPQCKATVATTTGVDSAGTTKYDPNISDSVISLRNCSSILHTSGNNHTIYRATSPSETAASLVRKTSTPMHQNKMVNADSAESMMCSSSVSSSSCCQVSSINGLHSSESETSPVLHASDVNAPQKSAFTGPSKSIAAKRTVRTKLPVAATPLRQVMSKSIQRALREHAAPENYTKSPLDLRSSPVVRRSSNENHSPSSKRYANRMANETDESATLDGVEGFGPHRRRRSFDSVSILETVYETAKNPDLDDECENQNETNQQIESSSKENNVAAGKTTNLLVPTIVTPSTSNSVTHANAIEDDGGAADVSMLSDVWYTPSGNVPISAEPNEKLEAFTPVLKVPNWPNKRPPLRRGSRLEIDSPDSNDICENDPISVSSSIVSNSTANGSSNKSSKLWTLVSTVLRFASLTPNEPPPEKAVAIVESSPEPIAEDSDSSIPHSPFIIKRCASFAGVVHKLSTTSPESSEVDDLQPNKRRRTNTVHGRISTDNDRYGKNHRIQGRPPIQRMRNNDSCN